MPTSRRADASSPHEDWRLLLETVRRFAGVVPLLSDIPSDQLELTILASKLSQVVETIGRSLERQNGLPDLSEITPALSALATLVDQLGVSFLVREAEFVDYDDDEDAERVAEESDDELLEDIRKLAAEIEVDGANDIDKAFAQASGDRYAYIRLLILCKRLLRRILIWLFRKKFKYADLLAPVIDRLLKAIDRKLGPSTKGNSSHIEDNGHPIPAPAAPAPSNVAPSGQCSIVVHLDKIWVVGAGNLDTDWIAQLWVNDRSSYTSPSRDVGTGGVIYPFPGSEDPTSGEDIATLMDNHCGQVKTVIKFNAREYDWVGVTEQSSDSWAAEQWCDKQKRTVTNTITVTVHEDNDDNKPSATVHAKLTVTWLCV